MSAPLILASASVVRAHLLKQAGLDFTVQSARVDEADLKAAFMGDGASLARHLACAKAAEVSSRQPSAFVIGADQVLSCGARLFDKPATIEEARANLRFLSGRAHQLHSGVCIARNGKPVWSEINTATLTMRPFSEAFLDQYLKSQGARVLASVGAYQLEGEGVQLFDKIEGDYFTILGLPLLPLLAFLRASDLLVT